jgi:AraC-like DNA-binding protein
LADPGLRTGGIAKALGVSPRAVQNVFEAMGTTVSAYILQGRLARAAGLIRAGRGAAPVTRIAYDCGFSDSAYFSRCFRKEYGVPPRRFLAG